MATSPKTSTKNNHVPELKEIASKAKLGLKEIEQIEKILTEKSNLSHDVIRKSMDWYLNELGLHEYYFNSTPVEEIAKHIESIKAAEIIAQNFPQDNVDVNLKTEQADRAVYLVDDYPEKSVEVERAFEKKYNTYRLECYRTPGVRNQKSHLRIYFIYTPEFKKNVKEYNTYSNACEVKFFESALPETNKRYEEAWKASVKMEAPYVKIKEAEGETNIIVVLNSDSDDTFISKFSDVLSTYGLYTNRKYVTPFANGKTIYSFYINKISDKEVLDNIKEDITLVAILPKTPIAKLFTRNILNAQETLFAVSNSEFAHQFLTTLNQEYIALSKALKDQPELLGMLGTMKTNLVKDTFTRAKINDVIMCHPEFVKTAYKAFNEKFNPEIKKRNYEKAIKKVTDMIKTEAKNDVDATILGSFVAFTNFVLKTNFYKTEKVSLSYRLDPNFLNKVDYVDTPFGLFFVNGKEFIGYHIRFRDIARGGIRLVKSRTEEDFEFKADFIFDENYNLAHTQQRKNKDIPEGGSKGTVLLNWASQSKAEPAFKKYIDGLLDLLMPTEEIVDYYGQQEILFLGPDENTADVMEWACQRAHERGYKFWKGFTTGKPLSIGGIPHDRYGMTTIGVHEMAMHILAKAGVKEETITKFQTGGPDGDLGSNEILISKDKTTAIVDGSGVIYDPKGLNREELVKLAKGRKMINHFDTAKLSKEGFRVLIEEKDVKLPNGEVIANGETFRNIFHLTKYAKADLFVPCGGRPKAININNYNQLLDENGVPRWKYISEGANLFITQEARLRLEEKGVSLVKDASANKGGVTSSSFEVLASLAMTDEQYKEWMIVENADKEKEKKFRMTYIGEIIEKIKLNAHLEFEAMWAENQKTKTPMAILSDVLSNKINQITDSLRESSLYEDEKIWRYAIENHCPKVLIKEIGLDTILKRVPQNYLRAIFGTHLASNYIYKNGLNANEVDFFKFIDSIKRNLK
ncbi:MAG: NAD-glutamate dehydrogenase [Candidatus Wallbacteria bacterium]